MGCTNDNPDGYTVTINGHTYQCAAFTICPAPQPALTPGFWFQSHPLASWERVDGLTALMHAVMLEDGERVCRVDEPERK